MPKLFDSVKKGYNTTEDILGVLRKAKKLLSTREIGDILGGIDPYGRLQSMRRCGLIEVEEELCHGNHKRQLWRIKK